MRALVVAFAFGSLVSLHPTHAGAQSAPAPAGAVAAPDLVRLKNGGLLRGTIAELVPDKAVTIVLVTGDRRTIPMNEVEYAGPAGGGPAGGTVKPAEKPASSAPSVRTEDAATEKSVRPLVTVRANEARLQLQAAEPGTTFYVRTGVAIGKYGGSIAAYDRICTAPCEATLPAGSYDMALAEGDGAPRSSSDPIVLDGPSTVRGTIESRLGLRLLGVAIAIGGTLGGLALSGSASTEHSECSRVTGTCHDVTEFDQGKLWGGVAVMAASVSAGMSMLVLLKDRAVITVSPGAVATSPLGPRTGSDVSGVLSTLAGLRLNGAF